MPFDPIEFVDKHTPGVDAAALAHMQSQYAAVQAEVEGGAGPIKTALDAASRAITLERSLRTTFYDSFAGKPDHTIVAGEMSDSGHPYTVRNTGGAAFQIVDGKLTHVQGDTGTTKSAYLGPDLGMSADAKISRIGCRFIIPNSANPPEALTLIASLLQFTQASDSTGFSVAACHTTLTLSADNILYQTLDTGSPFTNNNIRRGLFATLARDVPHVVDIAIRDGIAVMTVQPYGLEPVKFVTQYEQKIFTQNGPWPTWELTALSGATREMVQITDIWAEVDSRSELTSPAGSMVDVGIADARSGRVLGQTRTTGANAVTPITTSVSAALYTLPVIVPRTKKIRVRGLIWIDRIIPTTQASAALVVYADPGSSTYRKAQTVLSGTTPYNGSGSAFTMGALVPFEIDLDLSAFEVGSSQTVSIKASAGASGQFNFIDSGDASGSISTLRASTAEYLAIV